jgi:hypothetical protein
LSADYFEKISQGDWLEVRSRLHRPGKRLLFLSPTASLTIKLCFVFVQDAKNWPEFSCMQLTACFTSVAAANVRNLDKKYSFSFDRMIQIMAMGASLGSS